MVLLPVHDAALEGDLPTLQAHVLGNRALANALVPTMQEAVVDDLSADGCTPLMLAAYANAPECVAFLLAHGAWKERADSSGCTAAHWACINNSPAGLKALVEGGCDPNAQDDDAWTPLFVAIDWAAVDCALYLLSLPPEELDVDITDLHGYTAVHYAALAGQPEILLALLKRGADPTVRAAGGGPGRTGVVLHTALEMARYSQKPGAPACVAILEQAVEDAERAKALHRARSVVEGRARACVAAAAGSAAPTLAEGWGCLSFCPREAAVGPGTAPDVAQTALMVPMVSYQAAAPVLALPQLGVGEELTAVMQYVSGESNEEDGGMPYDVYVALMDMMMPEFARPRPRRKDSMDWE